MGPLPGSIVRIAAGRNAVEGNERLARPEPREAVAGHPVAPGGGVMDFHGIGQASRRDHDEVTSFDPDERRERKLGKFRRIPPHGKDTEPRAERGGSQVSERGAAWRRGREPAQAVRSRHGKSGELEKIGQRGRSAVVERRLKSGATLSDETCAAPPQ